MSSKARERWLALLMLLPSLVLFGVWIFWPLARTVRAGLYQTDFFGGNEVYVGWSQYWDVLTGPEFRHSLGVTIRFALLTVPAGLAIGVALAVLADKPLRGIRAFRTVFSSTVATSVAVASLMWLVLLNPSIGVLTRLLPFDVLKNPGLLNSPSWALFAVSLTTIWQSLGFTFIVMTAGLQGIPDDLYESAALDGAGAWQRFTGVTLPMLSPTLLFALVVLTIGAFNTFGQIDILTSGGPQQSTEVLVYAIYDNAFGSSTNQGVASVMSIGLFLLVVALSLVQFKALERRVHYGS